MDAVDFLKAKDEICTSYDQCFVCPLGEQQNGHNVKCTALMSVYPDEAVHIVESWVESHPTVNKVFYICDGQGCREARKEGTCFNPECHHTTDISHAKNFTECVFGEYWEKEEGYDSSVHIE